MNEELDRLVREIRNRSASVASYKAHFTASYKMQIMPFTASGTMYFQSPDRSRSETSMNGRDILSIRRSDEISRIITKRKEIWKYDLKGLLLADPINFGVSDLRNPFFAVDEDSLRYEGTVKTETGSEHTFTARVRSFMGAPTHLDTRKGFKIPFKPKGLDIQVRLRVDAETGLLRGMTGTAGSGEQVFQAAYSIEEMNLPMDSSLFELHESTATYKTINMSDVFAASMNPDAADAPPSIN
jgi:outer membrane lipoprotein-sorting protein